MSDWSNLLLLSSCIAVLSLCPLEQSPADVFLFLLGMQINVPDTNITNLNTARNSHGPYDHAALKHP